MRKPIVITALILMVAGAVAYWRSCTPGPSPATVAAQKRADSAIHLLDSTKVSDLRIIAVLKLDTLQKGRKLDTLIREKAALEKAQSTRATVIFRMLDVGDSALAHADTAAIIRNYIALAGGVRDIAPVIRSKDSITQAVIDQCFEIGKVKDSIANRWEHLYYAADTAVTLQKKANSLLQKDFDKKVFQVKVWKPIAIGGVGYIIADIIIHSLKK